VRMHGFDPAGMEPAETYSLLTQCVVPRPIAFVSSLSAEGVPNLAPFSFFNAGGARPPSIVFSPVTSRSEQFKDTLRNVEATREYVVHIVTYPLREQMNATSFEYPPDVDEFEIGGFTKVPSVKVKPWRAAECPIAMECRLFQVVHHGTGPHSANYVIGEIVYFHVHEAVLAEGRVDPARLAPIGRLGGPYYAHVTPETIIRLPRPTAPAR
jgi:flavin reductase (DIM6/NTAB) family NADH-FMN oxidoreductase RutF